MRLLRVIAEALGHGGTSADCSGCAYLCTDPARIEAALPGLAILSSAHAAVRARDGLCRLQDRVINGRRRCADFARSSPARAVSHRAES